VEHLRVHISESLIEATLMRCESGMQGPEFEYVNIAMLDERS